MAEQSNDKSVDQHYGRDNLVLAIQSALQAAGKNADALTVKDLGPLDQFHTGGRPATLELAQRAGIKAGMQILDVGGGLGGSARVLASEFDCTVTVLDITEEYCRAGEWLTERTGLSNRVTFQHGSALAIPFPDGSFDLAWTQHSSMNIADKERLYAEIYRVLRPSGRLALHEIMAGPESPVYFPVPWAREQSISHLRSQDAVRKLLTDTGFREIEWVDETPAAQQWFQERVGSVSTPSPLGLQLLLGSDTPLMMQNFLRNFTDHRVTAAQAVFERP